MNKKRVQKTVDRYKLFIESLRMFLSELPRQAALNLRNNAFFSSRHRLLYIATPKVACTSLKWWFAELLGVKREIEQATVSSESDPELVIHDSFARVAPEFTGANEAGLLEALSSPDYFRFCLVRNPYTRIFSAWQSKWLLREPLQVSFYPEAAAESSIESAADISKSFECFLRHLAKMGSGQNWDPHVAPQIALLDPEHIDYQMIAHIEDPSALVHALASRVGPGFRDPMSGMRANVSLLPYSATWISDDAAELIRTIYAHDFQVFGYDTAVPVGAKGLSDDALAMALRSIKLIRGRNARIGELIERLSVVRKEPMKSTSVDLTIQMYWAGCPDGMLVPFTEARSKFEVYHADDKHKTICLAFQDIQEPLARVRLDPANQPVAIALHGLVLRAADGTVLWRWDGQPGSLRNVLGLALRPGADGLLLVCWNDDPQFEIAIPEEVLASVGPGAQLVVEMTPRPLLEVLPELLAERPVLPATSPVYETQFCKPELSKSLEQIVVLLQSSLGRRDQVIAEQSMKLRAMRDELLRAEAQLDLLKDLMLGSRDEDRL